MKKQLAMLAMLAVVGSALLAPISAAAAHAEDGMDIDVYVLAGQSNAVGNSQLDQTVKGGTGTYRALLTQEDARNASGYSDIRYYGAIEIQATAAFPTYLSVTNVKMGQGLSGSHVGPELGMANVLSTRYTAESPAAVFKCAVGGTYLGDWQENTGNGNTQRFGNWASPSLIAEWQDSGKSVRQYAGKLYERLLDTVSTGIEKLEKEGYTPHIKAFLWMQGESDTENAEWANNYAHNLELFINDLREDVEEITGDNSIPIRPFVIGKIAEDFANHGQPHIAKVRAEEDLVAQRVPYTYTVETDGSDGLPKLSIGANNGSDLYHFNAKDVYELGKRFATVAMDHIAKYTYEVEADGGEVSKSLLFSDGEEVSFTYAASRGKRLTQVLLNGEDVTKTALSGDTITFTPNGDTQALNAVKLVFEDLTKYKLTVNLGEGGKIANRSISGSTVYAGEKVVFTLAPDEGYEVAEFTANGKAIAPDAEGKYTAEIDGDCTVAISFKKKGGASGGTSDPSGGTTEPSGGGEESGGGSGCAGSVAGGAAAATIVATVGACVLCRKKK